MKIKLLVLTFLTLFVGAMAPGLALAADPTPQDDIKCGINAAVGKDCDANPKAGQTISKTITSIINLMSALVGAIAVIMIIIAGFRFVVSAGNDSAVQSARQTVQWAAIGLIIVALAQVIVHFVLNNFAK